jgi:hypothetical protein
MPQMINAISFEQVNYLGYFAHVSSNQMGAGCASISAKNWLLALDRLAQRLNLATTMSGFGFFAGLKGAQDEMLRLFVPRCTSMQTEMGGTNKVMLSTRCTRPAFILNLRDAVGHMLRV